MKHNFKIVATILIMFIIAQFIGLLIFYSYDSYFGKTAQQKIQQGALIQPNVSIVKETVPPEMELKKPVDVVQVISSIVIAIIITTLLFILLSRIRTAIVIKIWFSVVIFICLTVALSLLLYPVVGKNLFSLFGKNISLAEIIAAPLALVLTFYKIVKRNIVVHNITELFIYPGLAIIFLPLVNVVVASILLIAISIYDIIAVWKTKHMISLAKFQLEQLKIFTGFFLPYLKPKDKAKIQKLKAMEARLKEKVKKQKIKIKKKMKKIKVNVQIAALGGGDVAFPLIFTGTMLMAYGLLAAIITILCSTVALFLLFAFSKKGKFYPAMPFLTAGCFAALLIILLI